LSRNRTPEAFHRRFRFLDHPGGHRGFADWLWVSSHGPFSYQEVVAVLDARHSPVASKNLAQLVAEYYTNVHYFSAGFLPLSLPPLKEAQIRGHPKHGGPR